MNSNGRSLHRRAYEKLKFNVFMARSNVRARHLFHKCGKRPAISGDTYIKIEGSAVVGDYLTVRGLTARINIYVAPGARLSIGDEVLMNGGHPLKPTIMSR